MEEDFIIIFEQLIKTFSNSIKELKGLTLLRTEGKINIRKKILIK